jgi:hypothetical protein
MGQLRDKHKILIYKPKRGSLESPSDIRDDNIKTDLKSNMMTGFELDSSGSGLGPVAGCCEHGNEPLSSIKYVETFNYLSDY